jgi:hypothetical protein
VSVVACVVEYRSPLDAHACLSWWDVFSPVVCCAACLVLECSNAHACLNWWDVFSRVVCCAASCSRMKCCTRDCKKLIDTCLLSFLCVFFLSLLVFTL